RRNECARPHPFLRAPSHGFLSDIRIGIPDESQAEAFANEPCTQVALVCGAGREPPTESIFAVGDAGSLARSNVSDQSVARVDPAIPRRASAIETDLIGLGSVDALEPNSLAADTILTAMASAMPSWSPIFGPQLLLLY